MKNYKSYRQQKRTNYVQQLDSAILRGDIDLSTVDPNKEVSGVSNREPSPFMPAVLPALN